MDLSNFFKRRIMVFFCAPLGGDLLGERRGKLRSFVARLFAVIYVVSIVIGGNYVFFAFF